MSHVDRTLLELAARSIDLEGEYCVFTIHDSDKVRIGIGKEDQWKWTEYLWNPLEDDGDAFRLMTALRIRLAYPDFEACGDTVIAQCNEIEFKAEEPIPDYRRAVVRLAAELGKLK